MKRGERWHPLHHRRVEVNTLMRLLRGEAQRRVGGSPELSGLQLAVDILERRWRCLQDQIGKLPEVYRKAQAKYEKAKTERQPMCEDCGVPLERYEQALDTGKDGWRCPECGFSWDES